MKTLILLLLCFIALIGFGQHNIPHLTLETSEINADGLLDEPK